MGGKLCQNRSLHVLRATQKGAPVLAKDATEYIVDKKINF